MLYAFGSNGSGQLGVGHASDLSQPESISLKNSSHACKIQQLAAGGNHTIILTNDEKLRATGNNEDGRCSVSDVKQTSHFVEVPLPSNENGNGQIQVKQITASWSSTIVLSTDGNVYTCGTGNSGELGLGPEIVNCSQLRSIPAFPPPNSQVVFVASGMAHSAAILSNGDIYGWGKGRKGQLGEPAEDSWGPRRIEGICFKATQAVCGKDFTLVVGDPSLGRLVLLRPNGRDRFGIKSDGPSSLAGWSSITASWGSIYALMSSGDIVTWGRNDRGQLPPQNLPDVEAIAAGSEHCLALTRSGKVLAWGWGEHGNCGSHTDENGDVKGRWNEIDVPKRARRVFAGCATSFVETDEEDDHD